MDFLSVILNFFSYTIFAYVGFSIFRRKKIVAYIILGVIFIQGLYNFMPYILIGASIKIIMIAFIYYLLPVIGAFLTFQYLTRTPGVKKYRRPKGEKKEKLSPYIYPQHYLKRVFITILSISILLLLLLCMSYFLLLDDMSILTFILLLVVLLISISYAIYGLYQYLSMNKEAIIIFIGKNKEVCYIHEISDKKPFMLKDIYQNDAYLIDQLGDLTVYQQRRMKEKYYVYWIATSTIFNIEHPQFKQIDFLYLSELIDVNKYHIIHKKLYK